MNYGFHLSTAGVITGMRRLDTIANNLANSNTIGFKADMLALKARRPENLENPVASLDTNRMLDALGGGTLFEPTAVDLRQGNLRQTGGPLDIAIEGEGFLQLATPAGQRDALLTRAGGLARNDDGHLVLATSGATVLSTAGTPITLDANDPNIDIDAEGRIYQSGNEVARLAIVVPDDTANLRKEGKDAFRLLGGRTSAAPGATRVRQGQLEESTVDPVLALADLVKVSRGIEFSTRLMQFQDQMTGRLIDTFGRFG